MNLSPAAHAAVGAVEQLTGGSRTAIIDDALLVYATLVDLGTHDGAYRAALPVAGRPLYVLVSRAEPADPRRSPWGLW